MAPGVVLTICATPPLPLPPCALEGQLMVELVPSFQSVAAPNVRAREKFAVVPEESERTARLIGVLGRLTPGLSDLIAGSFQVLVLPLKFPTSSEGIGESEPANWTTPAARSERPLPEPPPP